MAEKIYQSPAVQTPSISKLREIAAKFGMDEMPEQDLKDYQDHMGALLKSYNTLSKYPEPTLPVKYPRTPGYRPDKEENKLNAWYYKTDIQGASEGKLSGKTVAVKDCIPVAGVPMMNGSTIMEGYTPDIDATVVTRVLDQGGCIKGKAVNENLCLSSGHSFTSSNGPLRNPYDSTCSAGGSSNGCALLLASGEVDMALAADQGGSIRLPCSWCGVVGLKPSFGLVPYTGVTVIEPSVDYVGPMARNVRDCALLLEVIAGYDNGLDGRQSRDLKVPSYTEQLTGDLSGLKVGLVLEGFSECDADVASTVQAAATLMTKAGATVEDVSIPMHEDAKDLAMPVIVEGAYHNMLAGGWGIGLKGHYWTSGIIANDKGIKTMANDLTPTLKNLLMFGDYIKETHGVRFYAKAMNVGRLLTAAYDKALEAYDVIIMPTIKFKPLKLPPPGISVEDYLHAVFANIKNTVPFNVTGHPSLTVNAGFAGGFPVGMMIMGKQEHDATVLKVGHAFEQLRDAKK